MCVILNLYKIHRERNLVSSPRVAKLGFHETVYMGAHMSHTQCHCVLIRDKMLVPNGVQE